MKLNTNPSLSYSDVLVECSTGGQHVESRRSISTSQLIGGVSFSVPIVNAPMDTIGTIDIYRALAEMGSLPIVHRFLSLPSQLALSTELHSLELPYMMSVGVGEAAQDRVNYLLEYNPSIMCWLIDTANGYNPSIKSMVKFIRSHRVYSSLGLTPLIWAGNVCTPNGLDYLLGECGVEGVRVGIGGGCFAANTRILMSDGSYKNIQDIKLHDRVINKDGRAVNVTGVKFSGFKTTIQYKSNLFWQKSQVTPEHLHFVGDTSSTKDINKVCLRKILDQSDKLGGSKYKFLPIDQNKDNFSLMPRYIDFELPETFTIDLGEYTLSRRDMTGFKQLPIVKATYDLGYIFGTFLGDGTAAIYHTTRNGGKRNNTSGSLCWYFGLHEQRIADKLASAIKSVFGFNVQQKTTQNTINVTVRVNSLSRFFLTFGKKTNKHLPARFLCKNKDYLSGLLDGLIDSDGNLDGDRYSLSNTSTDMIELFGLVNYLVHGYYPSVSDKKISTGNLKGANMANFNPSYMIRSVKQPHFNWTQDFQINRVYQENIESESKTLVATYDIEVDCPTHSFIANHCIVHNSRCSTRIVTGCGLGQFTAVAECCDHRDLHYPGRTIIADGGIASSGDIVKALGAGADLVMAGSLFAGCQETDPKFKVGNQYLYRGMASKSIAESYGSEYAVAEGVEAIVEAKPSIKVIVNNLNLGLKSAMSYIGVTNLPDMRRYIQFRTITPSVWSESLPKYS